MSPRLSKPPRLPVRKIFRCEEWDSDYSLVRGTRRAIATRTAATTTAADKPPLQLDQTAPGSVRHGFGAANDIHLGEDRFHVRFHGAFADEQRGADLLVAFSLGH